MKFTFDLFAKSTGTILLAILTGCTIPPSVIDDESFPILAQKTFKAGIQNISERYIQPVQVSDLAIEGLRGLEDIDKSFKVELTSSGIVIGASQLPDYEYPKPLTENAEEWAKTMVAALQNSRAHSSLIGTASQEKLFEAIFDGSFSLLDPFSHYSGRDQAGNNRARRAGFGGIGVVLEVVPNGALILSVFESSPADVAGLIVNDLITHIDGILINGRTKKTILSAIRGEIGSFVKFTVRRKESPEFNVSLKRKRIFLPTVELIVENGILRIGIRKFNNETAQQVATKVQNALQKAENPVAGLIMDLRGNPGGVLSQAIKVADLFLVKGQILTTHGRHPSSRHEYVARTNDILAGLPLIVLVNGRSASASEIVAAALQDQKRALIVGTSSFGKGSVQTVTRLPNDGELTLTWSRFVTPSGYVLHNLGVPPNICSTGLNNNFENIILEATNNIAQFARIKKAWREVGVDNKLERDTLKLKCPASSKQREVDTKIAERLILDSTLYSRILSLSSSFASTRD